VARSGAAPLGLGCPSAAEPRHHGGEPHRGRAALRTSETETAATAAESLGRRTERYVHDLLRGALPPEFVLFQNLAWVIREHGVDREGEADIVVAHPELGFLAIEVKSGAILRDSQGRWWAGGRPLDRAPFKQAADSHHSLVTKLRELPDWPAGLDPIAGHAVAFPNAEMSSLGSAANFIGPDADPELILDKALLSAEGPRNQRIRDWVDRCFELWSGDAKRPPGDKGIELLAATITSPLELRSLLRSEIAEGNQELVRLTDEQLYILNTLRGVRRAAVVGGAGTGKTMLAMAKARQLANEGFETLLVCFNSALARVLADETRDVAERTGRLTVTTFHQLAEDLGREAGTLPEKPEPVTTDWFDVTLPGGLDDAISKLGPRYHAIVVDEGQDFDSGWLASLDGLLFGGREDVLYVFHDPAQSIFRADQTGELGLTEFPLDFNCRNPQPIHELLEPLALGGLDSLARRTDGRPPEFIKADVDAEAIEALRVVLHRLVQVEGVVPGSIAVLSGVGLDKSAVWRHRRFGNEVLWNGAVDDAGHVLGLVADEVPEQPPDVVLCDSVRRFKGLERPVIVLLEVPRDDPDRLDRLLYIGASRATQHLIVIAPTAVLRRLQS
jgi:AAA domain/UvrD-like helicase C-terminal domain/Nuclease-related domain